MVVLSNYVLITLHEALEEVEEELEDEKQKQRSAKRDTMKHQSILRPLTLGNWMFDVVAELVSPPAPAALLRQPTTFGANESRPVTRFAAPMDYRDPLLKAQYRQQRPSSVIVESPMSPSKRLLSLQFTPVTPTSTSFTLPMNHIRPSAAAEEEEEDEEFEQEKEAVKKSGGVARDGRGRHERRAVVTVAVDEKQSRRTHPTQESSKGNEEKDGEQEEEEEKRLPFRAIDRTVFPSIPNKPLDGLPMMLSNPSIMLLLLRSGRRIILFL
jgi:ATP-binding cassette subfamily B (MDR/TAP) protein 1